MIQSVGCSLKSISVIFLLAIFLCNLYFLSQLNDESILTKISDRKAANDFLVLDWTGKQHIFQEQDPIPCDFSHVNRNFCQSKFSSIQNFTVQMNLIERCLRLSMLTVRWSNDRSHLKQADLIAYHLIHMPTHRLPILKRHEDQQQYSMLFILESEVHWRGGTHWQEIDFPMWYNLERSYPEPATYFDLQLYLNYLFRPVRVPFEQKISRASIVWFISNCHAFNGRQTFVKELMSYLPIDSLGKCLNNVVPSTRIQQQNWEIYASYKFVLAIENSNCEDYVTEKLIEAFASTAIPIVASRDGKPNYLRFAPERSFINVYDFKSVKDLAEYLNYLSNNETAYNEYHWFRQSKIFTDRSLTENLRLAYETFDVNATICRWLLSKEKSRNKFCKLTEFIFSHDWRWIYQQKTTRRPTAAEMCLGENDLPSYFGNPH